MDTRRTGLFRCVHGYVCECAGLSLRSAGAYGCCLVSLGVLCRQGVLKPQLANNSNASALPALWELTPKTTFARALGHRAAQGTTHTNQPCACTYLHTMCG